MNRPGAAPSPSPVRAEWTKLRSLPLLPWLLVAVAAATVLAGAATVAPVDTDACPTPAGCHEDLARLSLAGVRVGQVPAVVLAVLVIGGEYATGTLQATLAATPRRLVVLRAKALVVAATVLVAGAVGTLGSLAVGRLLLPRNGFTQEYGYPALSLADGPTLRAAAGTVLYLVLVALLALGVGVAVRESAAAVSAVLGLLFLVPVVVALMVDERWRERLARLAPMDAGLAVQATRNLAELPIGPWAGLGVLAGYAAAALCLGGLLFTRRDAA